jgi:LCP family protein required for cell wall assembly
MRTRLLALLAVFALAAATPVAALRLAARPLGDDRYTVLVMGSDQGPWRSGTVLEGRSDALHLVSVVPSQGAASILSFPRDTYVPVPGFGTTRINAALTRGPDTAVRTVRDLTGIEIDDWIVTGLQSFHNGINAFGDIPIDVPQRLNVDDSVIQPGAQRLDGPGALIYARDRKSRSDGDFGRNRAQAEVLAVLHSELVARDPSPRQLAKIMVDLRRSTVSSISAPRMLLLGRTALQIDPARVTRRQVPGRNAMRGSAAVVVPTSGAQGLYADLRDDGLFDS